MPRLLPGILELSRRARYFSFHAWLLDKYRELRMPADGNSLSTFIKAREWEYGLAVLHCPHELRVQPGRCPEPARRRQPPGPALPAWSVRGERLRRLRALLPLAACRTRHRGPRRHPARRHADHGRRPLRHRPRPPARFDVPGRRGGHRVRDVMDADHGPDPPGRSRRLRPRRLPVSAPRAPSRTRRGPRRAVRRRPRHTARPRSRRRSRAGDPEDEEELANLAGVAPGAAVTQRRRSVAHYLTLVDADPQVVDDEGAYREALWSPPPYRSPEHERVAGQWAGLVAKDVWQDALCSIWSSSAGRG